MNSFLDLSSGKTAVAEISYPSHVTVTASVIPDSSGSFAFLSLGPHSFRVDASGIQTESGTRASLGSSPLNPAFSPQHLLREGITKSDWYYLQRGNNLYYVYCDLTTEGPSGEKGHILFLSFKGTSYNYRSALLNEEYVITSDRTIPFPVNNSNKYKIGLPEADFPDLRYIAMSIDDTAYQYSFPYWNSVNSGTRYYKHIMNVDPSGVNASVSEPFRFWVRNTGYYMAGGTQHFGLRYSDSNSFRTVQVQSASSNGTGFYGANTTMYMIQGIPQNNNFSSWVLSTNTNTPWSGTNTNGEWGAHDNRSTRGFSNAWAWNGAAIYAFAFFAEPTFSPIVVRPANWNQYSIVYDASGTVRYFVDGVLFASKTLPTPVLPTSVTLRSGRFRRVAMYDRAMTQDHLLAISRFPDLNTFSYQALGSSTNPAKSPQELVSNGIMTSGTHWLDISGNAKAHYLNLSINSRKGYVLLAATDASGGWNPFSSNRLLDRMAANGIYNVSGAIGQYSIDYDVVTYGISHFLLVTGDGQFWMEFPVEHIRTATTTFATRTVTAGVLPTGQQTMGVRLEGNFVRIYADSTQNANRCFWSEGGLSTETTMKTSFGGVYLYGYMGNITGQANQLIPLVFGSRGNPVFYTDIPKGTNQIVWVKNTKDVSIQPLHIWSYSHCHENEPFALVGGTKSSGNWGTFDSGNGSLSDNLRGNVEFGNYLQGDFLTRFSMYFYNKYLFMTGDEEFWFTVSSKDFENLGTATGIRTVPILQKSSNLTQTIAYVRFDGLPSSPFVSLTSDFTNYVFWGENDSSYGVSFKNLHGGTRLFIGGQVSLGYDETAPVSSVSQLVAEGNTSNGTYWISVNGTPRLWYHNLTWNDSAGYTHVGFLRQWRSAANDILRGLVSIPLDASTNEFVHAFQGVPFTTFLFRSRDGDKFFEISKNDIYLTNNTANSGLQGVVPLVSSSDPLVTTAFVKIQDQSWTISLGTEYDPSQIIWSSQGAIDDDGVDLYIGRTPEPSARYWRIRVVLPSSSSSSCAFEELSLYSSRTQGTISLSNHPTKEVASVSLVSGQVANNTDLSWLTNGIYTFESPVTMSGTSIILEYDLGSVKEVSQLVASPNQSCSLVLSYSNDRQSWTTVTTIQVQPVTLFDCMVYQKVRLDTWRYVSTFKGFNETQVYTPSNENAPIELKAHLSNPTRLHFVQVVKDSRPQYPVPKVVIYGSNDDQEYQYINTVTNSLPKIIDYPQEPKLLSALTVKEYDSWNFAVSPYSSYYRQSVIAPNLSTSTKGLRDDGYAYSIDLPNTIQTVEFEYLFETLSGNRDIAEVSQICKIRLENGKFVVTNLQTSPNIIFTIPITLEVNAGYQFLISWSANELRIFLNGSRVLHQTW